MVSLEAPGRTRWSPSALSCCHGTATSLSPMPRKPPTETIAIVILSPDVTIRSSTLPTRWFWSFCTACPMILLARTPFSSLSVATARLGLLVVVTTPVADGGDVDGAGGDPGTVEVGGVVAGSCVDGCASTGKAVVAATAESTTAAI